MSLSVLTVCDNVTDILLPDQGPAKRLPLAAMARLAPLLEAPTIAGGKAADDRSVLITGAVDRVTGVQGQREGALAERRAG